MVVVNSAPALDRESSTAVSRRGWMLMSGLLLSAVLLQRIGVPAGSYSVPLLLPLGLAATGLLVYWGDLRFGGLRAGLFLLAVAAMATAAYVATWYSSEVHLASLVTVLAVWTPWALRASGSETANRDGFRRMARLYKNTMLGLSMVAVLQLTSQFIGLWTYQDLVARYVPSELLIPGYNTSIPMAWASPIYKSQAFLFLEPSHFSQFTAIAVIVAILLRAPLWQVALLALGLVSALSGTGIIVVAVGLVLMAIRVPRLIRPAYIIAVGIGLIAALLTPLSAVFTNRVSEVDSQTTSFSLRFVLPYQEVAAGMHEDARRWVSGAGPGASDRLLESGQHRAGLFIVYTIPTKLLFEYGLLPAVAFLGFLFTALFRAPPAPVLPGTALVWLFFMGGYLAIPAVVWTVWLLSPVWSVRE